LLRRTKGGYTALSYRFDEEAMLLKVSTALCLGLAAFTLAATQADAQTRQQQRVAVDGTRYTERGEDGRLRTKVIVQRRSFLDAGTEVRPGERKFTDYVYPPGYSPTSAVDGTNGFGRRFPLPGFWDLSGPNNPYPWQP
jgi:hypothetical protein